MWLDMKEKTPQSLSLGEQVAAKNTEINYAHWSVARCQLYALSRVAENEDEILVHKFAKM